MDTNIFVYAAEPGDSFRRVKSIWLLKTLGPQIVVSTQVMQEFYAASKRKMGMDARQAREYIVQMSECEVVGTTPQLIVESIDLSIVTGLSIWDSLIVAAAISSRCKRILTEDLNHGQLIHGVRVENPFIEA